MLRLSLLSAFVALAFHIAPAEASGAYVYCSAPSICGKRGGNALPGNWGWTSNLFGGIKQSYPHVWCSLYPHSCARR